MTVPTLEPINVADGDRVIRGFKYDKAVHPAEPIQTVRPLAINNIKKRVVKKVNLNSFVGYAFEVYAITANISSDNKKFLDGTGDPRKDMPWARVQVDILFEDEIEQPLQFFFSNYVQYLSTIIVKKDRVLHIESNQDIDEITLYIKPINLEQTINVP